jgi:gamma-glutamylcyclotransferase
MTDKFLYFAYGSNMLTRRLRKRTPSAAAIGTGFVEGHRLSFDKVSTDGSGKCNIAPTNDPADRVYGVLFSIKIREAQKLDEAEGVGKGYHKSSVQVVSPTGVQVAVAYIADNTNSLLLPYDWYKDFVVRGAIEHKLPAVYVRRLQTAGSQRDSNEKRRARNEAVLAET